MKYFKTLWRMTKGGEPLRPIHANADVDRPHQATRRQWFLGAFGAAMGGTAVVVESALRPSGAVAQTVSYVDTTSNQTIGGTKTFTSPPIVPAASFPETAVVDLTASLAAKAPLTGPFAPTSPGATAPTRYLGGTASGPPVAGTFAAGDFVVDQTGKVWICTVAGAPGTWVHQAGVDLTSDQTVGGVKTFLAAPVVPAGAFPESSVSGLVDDLANATAAISNLVPKDQAVNDAAGTIVFRIDPNSHPGNPIKLVLGAPLISANSQSVYDPTATFGFHSDVGGAQNLIAFELDYWTNTGFDGQWHHQCEQHSLFFSADGVQHRPWSWSGHYATGQVDFGIFSEYFSINDPYRQVMAFSPGSTLKIFRDIEFGTSVGFKTAQLLLKGNEVKIDASGSTLPANGCSLTLAGAVGTVNRINFGSGADQRWLIYDAGSRDTLYVRDTVNNVQQIVLGASATPTWRYTYLNSKVQVAQGLGVFGHTPPASQPATPATLADVIALLRACGFCA